ncbi:MAG: hypothetical protein DMG30_26890 [Acidobacteria bacterium]|nr:MAG: hypothetical protein DMG30_26890 [Acidobacteriota bacterium]
MPPLKGTMPEKKREELRVRRESLFQRFEKNPDQMHLALKIKIIDDQIAECTHLIKQKRKRQS